MTDSYNLNLSVFPLSDPITGLPIGAGHVFLALVNSSNGVVLNEFNGLATDRYGNAMPIGNPLDFTDRIQLHITGERLYSSSILVKTLMTLSPDDARDITRYAGVVGQAINSKNLGYWLGGETRHQPLHLAAL